MQNRGHIFVIILIVVCSVSIFSLFTSAEEAEAAKTKLYVKPAEPTYDQNIAANVNLLDRVFQNVFDKESNPYFSKPLVVFVDPGMRSLQPRGPSVLDLGATFPNDPAGIREKLVGAKTPKVYGSVTGIVCGDKLCKPHPFKAQFAELKNKVRAGNTAEAMIILEQIRGELATKYPAQSVLLQGDLAAVMMSASAKASPIQKDVELNCEGKVLLERINGKFACTFPATALKLVERGWGKIVE